MLIILLFIYVADWNNLVVGKVSPWLKLDSPHHHVRRTSELVRLLHILTYSWADDEMCTLIVFDQTEGC